MRGVSEEGGRRRSKRYLGLGRALGVESGGARGGFFRAVGRSAPEGPKRERQPLRGLP